MKLIEMDESEENSDKPAKWWECLDDTASWLRFNYADIMENGSDELKRAAEIVLNGSAPAIYTKEA